MGHYKNFTKEKGVLDKQLIQNYTSKKGRNQKFVTMLVFQSIIFIPFHAT